MLSVRSCSLQLSDHVWRRNTTVPLSSEVAFQPVIISERNGQVTSPSRSPPSRDALSQTEKSHRRVTADMLLRPRLSLMLGIEPGLKRTTLTRIPNAFVPPRPRNCPGCAVRSSLNHMLLKDIQGPYNNQRPPTSTTPSFFIFSKAQHNWAWLSNISFPCRHSISIAHSTTTRCCKPLCHLPQAKACYSMHTSPFRPQHHGIDPMEVGRDHSFIVIIYLFPSSSHASLPVLPMLLVVISLL